MLDSVRYSLANLETSPESELDVILGQLCALETQIDRELLAKVEKSVSKDNEQKSKMTTNDEVLTPTDNTVNGQTMTDPSYSNRSHRRSGSGGGSSTEMQYTNGVRTDSPDNDSAYSDSLSMLSSEQSSSSGGASVSNSSQILPKTNSTQPKDVQLFIKVFTADNSAKSLLADERMTVSVICRQLAEKNHIIMDPKCSILEHIPELYLERFYEDNESLVENVLLWTRDSCNRLYFMEKEEKYDLFVNPEKYLLGWSSSERDSQLDDEAKSTLIEEFFTAGAVGVPEVEGNLFLKSDGKKAWKKHFFVLRASGLYYCPKGKSKSSKDLVCLTTFEMNNVYYGFGWRKKYKAPNDFGFAIKHPQIQAKSSKYIKYLCAEDENELKLWTTGIRIAKYGRQLKDNYENIMRDIVEADLDSLANRRSFSVCSMAKTMQVSPTSPTNTSPVRDNNSCEDGLIVRHTIVNAITNSNNNWHRMSRQDSIRSSSTSSSSGCLSERGSNVSTPTMETLAFEVDFPVGTIKRKPSAMQPKIPLTTTTRNLALQSDDALVEVDSSSSEEEMGIQRSCGTLKSGTLRRSATDERLKNRIYEPLQRFQNINNNSIKLNDTSPPIRSQSNIDDTIVDELPLPPPPQVLTTSLSTLSLNSLPPPPSEVLESPDFSSNTTTPKASPVVSPKKSPQSPLVPPKPKLFRRLSESANDRNTYINDMKRGCLTLHKGYNNRNKLSIDLNSVSCYATSPRMRCGPFFKMGSKLTQQDSGSLSLESSPKTPVNEVMPSTHQKSPVRQNCNHQQMTSPVNHCCQPLNLYQNIQQTRQTQVIEQYQNQYQNNNLNNIISHHNIQQHYNNSNNVNNNKMGHQLQPQPYYQHSHQHQNYSNPSLPMQSIPQQYYQQIPVQQIAPQFQQISHHQQQQQQQQRPQQLSLQQMQHYSNPQPIYQSNNSGAHQTQPNYQMNGQTYTKSKIIYNNNNVSQIDRSNRSPMKGPLPAPPETFLREIKRVMEKKWKVAQTLSNDLSSTPNQILGFRDPAYLPPNANAHNSVVYDVLPSRPVKSVRISSQVHEIPNCKHRRLPPPPPKRSEATHLSQRQV